MAHNTAEAEVKRPFLGKDLGRAADDSASGFSVEQLGATPIRSSGGTQR